MIPLAGGWLGDTDYDRWKTDPEYLRDTPPEEDEEPGLLPYYTDDEGYREIAIYAEVRGVTVHPAAVCLQFPNCGGMQEANAHLIAAAPDLLEVCKEFIDKLGPDGYYPEAGAPLTAKMRAAIASAEGHVKGGGQ